MIDQKVGKARPCGQFFLQQDQQQEKPMVKLLQSDEQY
jgi:hypothetical protein